MSVRAAIVDVLRDHDEVRSIGALADKLEAALTPPPVTQPTGWVLTDVNGRVRAFSDNPFDGQVWREQGYIVREYFATQPPQPNAGGYSEPGSSYNPSADLIADQPPVQHVDVAAKEKAAFNHGYLLACCNIANLHDRPEIAFDILQELGISKAEVKAMQLCDYDKKALKEIEQARGNSTLYCESQPPAPVSREDVS